MVRGMQGEGENSNGRGQENDSSTEMKGVELDQVIPYWMSCCLKNGTSGKVRVMS